MVIVNLLFSLGLFRTLAGGGAAIFVLKLFVLGIPGSRFRATELKIVIKTSRDHLSIQDLCRPSIEMSRISSRKKAVAERLCLLLRNIAPHKCHRGQIQTKIEDRRLRAKAGGQILRWA